MPVQPNMKYPYAKVLDAYLAESSTGTPSIFFSLKTEDGNISNSLYCTPAALERTRQVMYDCFGTSNDDLIEMSNSGNWSRLKGDEVSITTIEEEYQGDMKVKVQWMNPAGGGAKKAEPVTRKRVAGLFGGGPVSSPKYTDRTVPVAPAPAYNTEDDVPF